MEAPLIRVLLFEPGKPERFVELADHHLEYRKLLGTDTLDFTPLLSRDRWYQLWCDDFAYRKELPENRLLVGTRHRGHMIRGPFFITRIRGDRDTSVDETDLPYIGRFVDMPT